MVPPWGQVNLFLFHRWKKQFGEIKTVGPPGARGEILSKWLINCSSRQLFFHRSDRFVYILLVFGPNGEKKQNGENKTPARPEAGKAKSQK